jgi:type IV pilus assembly protein PilE
MSQRFGLTRRSRAAGFTLVELMVVTVMIGILTSMTVPSFRRAVERAKADLAAAQLQGVWSAQQVYWLENRTYATSLSELTSLGLLDQSVSNKDQSYLYAITTANASTFAASATRQKSNTWSGKLTIDQTGAVAGSINAKGLPPIVPQTK